MKNPTMTNETYNNALRWITLASFTLALIVAILLIIRYVQQWN